MKQITAQTNTLKDASIVIIDDAKANVILLKRLLEAQEYTSVKGFTDPKEGLQWVLQEPPDLLLLDLNMPGLDGFSLMKQVRKNLVDVFLPILVLSADIAVQSRHRALAEGAEDFLTKPFDAKEVLQRIRNLLLMGSLVKEQQAYNETLKQAVRERTRQLEESNTLLRKMNRELETLRRETLLRLAQVAEYRDDDTQLHTHRVGLLAFHLATRLNLPTKHCHLIAQAARLHDLGKIGIPDRILLKPGRLNDQEMNIMRQHTHIGAKLLAGSNSSVLRIASVIALTHHERWDGSGYPQGLKEDAIPLEGRIVALADVFDALTNDRPFKRAWTYQETIDLIISERGKAFDPRLVDVFIEMIPDAIAKLAAVVSPTNERLLI